MAAGRQGGGELRGRREGSATCLSQGSSILDDRLGWAQLILRGISVISIHQHYLLVGFVT